jgi:hypothetical protein
MISDHPELFVGNSDVDRVFPLDGIYETFSKMWQREFCIIAYETLSGDRSNPSSRHIIAEVCTRAGITGPVALRPYLTLDHAERAGGAWASGYIVIQSSGLAAKYPMLNKEWYSERFQSLVNSLGRQYEFIQIGSAADPALSGARDLRGRTSIRQSAAILHHARLYVGTVGFLMHLARAVDCPSVIVYGGREAPSQSGYICNKNLYTALPCAPCWRWNTCDIDRKCMSQILAENVVASIHEMMSKPRTPLTVETVSGYEGVCTDNAVSKIFVAKDDTAPQPNHGGYRTIQMRRDLI